MGSQIPSPEGSQSHGDVALRAVSVGTVGWVGVGVGDLRGHFQPQRSYDSVLEMFSVLLAGEITQICCDAVGGLI